MHNWSRKDLLKVTEALIDMDCPLFTHPRFRKGFSHDLNLFANQIIREANSNSAFRSVDFEIDGLDNGSFWDMIDDTKHADFIEETAATNLLKMAAKLNLLN